MSPLVSCRGGVPPVLLGGEGLRGGGAAHVSTIEITPAVVVKGPVSQLQTGAGSSLLHLPGGSVMRSDCSSCLALLIRGKGRLIRGLAFATFKRILP